MAFASSSSTGPSINVSGVRNSWLTLLKNAVFARSSSAKASSRFFSSSAERAFWIAAATWSATRSKNVWYSASIRRVGFTPAMRHPRAGPLRERLWATRWLATVAAPRRPGETFDLRDGHNPRTAFLPRRRMAITNGVRCRSQFNQIWASSRTPCSNPQPAANVIACLRPPSRKQCERNVIRVLRKCAHRPIAGGLCGFLHQCIGGKFRERAQSPRIDALWA